MPRSKTQSPPANASVPTARVVPLTEFKLDQANTRKRTDRGKATIRASLDQFGAARSVVADRDNVIRAGNGTLEQAIEAGMEALVVEPSPNQLVVVRRPDWTPTQAIAYGVADNRIPKLAVDDDEALASVLEGLQEEGFDLEAVGYEDPELDALLAGLGGDDDDSDTDDDPDDGDSDPGPGPTSPSSDKLGVVAITLTRSQYQRWKARKAEIGINSDTAAFVKIAGLEG